ncbi:Voltage-gated hydrogen channel 1 [Manis javanica]|nr:Voltage-gated hydrogen channel 1 [Manis javanica]
MDGNQICCKYLNNFNCSHPVSTVSNTVSPRELAHTPFQGCSVWVTCPTSASRGTHFDEQSTAPDPAGGGRGGRKGGAAARSLQLLRRQRAGGARGENTKTQRGKATCLGAHSQRRQSQNVRPDMDDRKMDTWDEKAVTRRARVAPAERMSKFLRHFTVVGDDYQAWNINYKKWENEEEDEEEEQPPAPASGEEGGAADPAAAPVPAPRPPLDFRTTLRKLFSAHRFQVIIICLVILDALLVLAELILDLNIIQLDNNYAAKVFHYMSIAILTFFMVEFCFKLYVFRLEFFHHKFEILDAIVVVVSFVLDIVLLFREHEFEALGLLILLRLWRVARIINGIIISVKTRSERQLLRLKQMNIQLAAKIQHLEFSCSEKEQEIERLNKLLRQHGLLGEVN